MICTKRANLTYIIRLCDRFCNIIYSFYSKYEVCFYYGVFSEEAVALTTFARPCLRHDRAAKKFFQGCQALRARHP